MGKISKSTVRTGVAYKRGEKRTEKVKEQKQKQKGRVLEFSVLVQVLLAN